MKAMLYKLLTGIRLLALVLTLAGAGAFFYSNAHAADSSKAPEAPKTEKHEDDDKNEHEDHDEEDDD